MRVRTSLKEVIQEKCGDGIMSAQLPASHVHVSGGGRTLFELPA